MDRILVAVDGSEVALRAVDLAADIAGQRDVEFVIATVADSGLGEAGLEAFAYSEHVVGPIAERLRRTAEKILDVARERAVRAGVKRPHVELRSGGAADQILELAAQRKVDLLVFGCRGRSAEGQKHILGGTAFKLANLAPCNIAVAR